MHNHKSRNKNKWEKVIIISKFKMLKMFLNQIKIKFRHKINKVKLRSRFQHKNSLHLYNKLLIIDSSNSK